MKNCNYVRALQFCIENGIVLEQYEMEQLEYLYEGANIDIVKIGWNAFKNYKSYSNQVNELIDQKNYNGAIQALQKLKSTNTQFENQFNAIDASNVSSKTFGALASIGINALQAIFPLTSKLAAVKDTISLTPRITHKAAYYASIADNSGKMWVKQPANNAHTAIGRGINNLNRKAGEGIARGLGKNAKIASAAGKAIKPLTKVGKVASKVAKPVRIILTAGETIAKTIKDYKKMQQDAKDGKFADNNLFKSKIMQLFKTLDTQIENLESYLKICIQSNSNNNNQQQISQNQSEAQPAQ